MSFHFLFYSCLFTFIFLHTEAQQRSIFFQYICLMVEVAPEEKISRENDKKASFVLLCHIYALPSSHLLKNFNVQILRQWCLYSLIEGMKKNSWIIVYILYYWAPCLLGNEPCWHNFFFSGGRNWEVWNV